MEQADQIVPGGHLLHPLHGQLVVVGGDVDGGVDGGQLMLGGGHLVVLGLGQNTQLPQLAVQIGHIGGHPGLDGAKIVVVHLLPLGGPGAEQGPAGKPQVPALGPHVRVHQEVLLFRAHGGAYPLHLCIAKQPQHPQGLPVQGLHGAQERGLFVQGLPVVAAEGGGDAQGSVLEKGVGGGVPGGVAPGLEGGPQPSGGEGGGVRLPLNQLLSGELHDNPAVGGGGYKAVVLLGGHAGEGLEPVGKMGRPMGHGPVLYGRRHGVGHPDVQLFSLVNGPL